MCLIRNLEVNKVKLALKDIECYKVILQKSSRYFSPIQNREISEEEVQGKELYLPKRKLPYKPIYKIDTNPINKDHMLVGDSCIHTYKNKKEAISITQDLLSRIKLCEAETTVLLFKCIVPRGIEYVDGKDYGDNTPCYASKGIKFIEQVNICA